MSYQRNDGRTALQMRPFTYQINPFGYGDATVLMSIGNTKVLVAVTLNDGVPIFLRNSENGWLTAEYAMLPTATRTRNQRAAVGRKPKGRDIEISRLIGRSLRSVIDLNGIGEKTIQVDCDVLQADGGTRTACITAASLALEIALEKWNAAGRFKRDLETQRIVALSAGIVEGQILVDLNQDEDCAADADVNVVMAQDGTLVEIQATAERSSFTWDQFVTLKDGLATEMRQLLHAEQ